jgi:hypothetical protein
MIYFQTNSHKKTGQQCPVCSLLAHPVLTPLCVEQACAA